ncbi:MAG: sigma-70 family RNA polymerase sigma factor [Deltaproteobacteria bacterium]
MPVTCEQPHNVVKFGRDERDFVYSVARRIVKSPEAAEDVAQDALLLAYRHRDSFRGDSKYRTWLYRIASTTALGHLRRDRRSRESLATNDETVDREIADPSRSPETLVGDLEVAARARRVLDQLAPKYRDVVMMRTEMTENETATRLGITVANVKIRAHRARQQLRDALARGPANDDLAQSSRL